MVKTDVNILSEFKDLLNKCTTPYIGEMYNHLFSILSDEELTELLTHYQSVYNEDREGWFYQFHKSIRQCDFFGNNLRSYRVVDKLTEEQSKRREELRKIWNKQYKLFLTEHPDEDWDAYKEFKRLPGNQSILNELKELNSISGTKEEVSINGHLDMIFWNTIHLDRANELKKILERTFKICA